MQFTFSTNIDKNQAFIVNRSELEGRIEAEYYKPEIAEIEKKVRSQSSRRLKAYIKKMSSGATPSIQEVDKYYADSDTGIPFLRVQNLQTNGNVNLQDVKYINLTTHQNYLKRSQVSEYDLLVKITGVGRMAIASVAPKGFIGNTNQHMVVIKTPNKETSDYLANYLNLDIVEKIASRRATGGTRPALDYPALKSIPIIEGIDFSVLKEVEIQKQQKEAEAKLLLASIDVYLLSELGITIPQKDNILQNRIFTTSLSELSGSRFDPKLYEKYTVELKQAIADTTFNKKTLRELLIHSVAGNWGTDDVEIVPSGFQRVLVIRATEFENDGNLNLENSRVKYRTLAISQLKKIDVQENDLLIEKSGGSPDQPVGRVSIITKEILESNNIGFSNFIHKIRVDENIIVPEYLFFFLKAMHNLKLTDAMQSQTNGIRNLIMNNYWSQIIPLPTIAKQNEIVMHLSSIRNSITTLRKDASDILSKAKSEIENKILG